MKILKQYMARRKAARKGWHGAGVLALAAVAIAAHAAVLDVFGPPDPSDPSAHTDQPSDAPLGEMRPRFNGGPANMPLSMHRRP
jgi:hypothetical protein